ncbi:TetR/AcrR family transcriptional regulator [Halopiger djelfimassiliensis]|uniref:TetR/AcrR family transcriptional regulator n=1 Tax=Halopiger djelfimassiliensis TaxID=1293047 RepID=UPI00067827D9|nr:TetR/AcrR family transcriptional regulator [Halopiger djelfimassiliensis]
MTDPDVRETIMSATYDALCERGYTELTAQDIADRTDKSKSLLFYHYDSKEDLVADFLEFLLERFDERVAETEELPPTERLAAFIDWFLYGSSDDERQSFHTALLELRTQAPYNERYREQLRENDERLRGLLAEILQEGIETGEFVDHDPERTAALLLAAMDGARIRQLTLDRDVYLEAVRSAIVARIIEDLLAEEGRFPVDRQPNDDRRRPGEPSGSTDAETDEHSDDTTDTDPE